MAVVDFVDLRKRIDVETSGAARRALLDASDDVLAAFVKLGDDYPGIPPEFGEMLCRVCEVLVEHDVAPEDAVLMVQVGTEMVRRALGRGSRGGGPKSA